MVLSLATAVVLARLLTPEDFGVFSLGMVFLTLFLSTQDFGIFTAVVQRDTRIDECISVGLTLRWITAVLLFFGAVTFSPLVAIYVGNHSISAVVIVLALNLFILIYAFPSQVLLTRSLGFYRLSVASVVQYTVISVMSIALAFLGFTYWGLVYGSVSGSVAFVIVLRYFESREYKPRLDGRLMSELLGFGKHILISSLMGFVIFNLDQIAIAGVVGVASVGIYYLAVKLGRTVGEQIAATVNKVLFPTMSRLKDNPELLRTSYVQSLRMIAIIAVPLSVGTSALAPVLVPALLGEEWSAVIIPLAILSFQGLLNALIPPAANVLISIGRPRYISIQATIQALALVVGVYPAALYFGINGVCVLTTFLSFGVLIYFLLVYSSIQKQSFRSVVRPILPPAVSGSVVFLVLSSLIHALPSGLFSFLALVAIGGLLYVVLLHFVSGGHDVRDFLSLMKGAVRGP